VTHEKDHILVWGAETSIHFVSGRPSPTRFVYQYPLYTPGYHTAANDGARAQPDETPGEHLPPPNAHPKERIKMFPFAPESGNMLRLYLIITVALENPLGQTSCLTIPLQDGWTVAAVGLVDEPVFSKGVDRGPQQLATRNAAFLCVPPAGGEHLRVPRTWQLTAINHRRTGDLVLQTTANETKPQGLISREVAHDSSGRCKPSGVGG
jgi:hypothetical protein